ncbi:MAG: amino acid adenylation domain-containing protein [Pseudomonadota bacterium]
MATFAASLPFGLDETRADDTLGALWTKAHDAFGTRTALSIKDTSYSYDDLDLRARALAARLHGAGLQAGDVCGIYLGRSAECVIAILAVTLAGGAWLPLDPAYPKARLRAMADEVGIKLLLVESDTEPLAVNCRAEILHVSADAPSAPVSDAAGPGWRARGDDLAYIIYTSGSTGRPKGIQIHQKALITYLASMADVLPQQTMACVLSVSSPSFDISLLDLFLTFRAGGTLVLASAGEARDGRRLKDRIEAARPSLLQATPATWRLLLAAGWQGDEALTLLTGAEAISPRMARELKARAKSVWNLYGPTETTLWATAGEITDDDVQCGTIPIGRALAHFETLILDEARNPVNTGEVGELWLLGPTLSRGYVAQPALTAARFVQLPQGTAYRTGDRVAVRPDGQLSFHGRIDNQIKLNSVRIEPAEVEAVLVRHRGVREAIVAARGLKGDEEAKRLVAYIVPAAQASDRDGLVPALQQLAKAHLPAAMCPAQYVEVSDLPLTPSGKIDRNGLPAPESIRPELATTYVAARDALELRLAALMAEALDVRPVGVQDSFFDLGGDSLATVEFLLALENALDVKIELNGFLEEPTVEALARTINQARAFRPSTALVSLRTEGSEPPLFLIHGAGGLAFTVFELGQAVEGDFPVFAVQDPACDLATEPLRTVPAMATALIAQIRTAQPQGPYRLCGHSFGGLLAYEMALQLEQEGQTVSFVGLIDTPTPPLSSTGRGVLPALRNTWREVRFFFQILTQAGPMALDGLYVLFGAEARYQQAMGERASSLSALWTNAMFRAFHKASGLASAVDRNSRLLMMRQPGIRRSIQLTGLHDQARRAYRPERYSGRVDLFRAQEASAETKGFDEETLGWAALARGVDTHWVPGSHFTMTRGSHLAVLVKLLKSALEGSR